jgi:hypothetical protein
MSNLEEALKAEIVRLSTERFGDLGTPYDPDIVLGKMVIYHDVRQILAEPNIINDLKKIIDLPSNGAGLAESLCSLNERIDGFRIILKLSTSGISAEDASKSLSADSFLNDVDKSRLRELIGLYFLIIRNIERFDLFNLFYIDEAASNLDRFPSTPKIYDRVGLINSDDESFINCINTNLINSYLEDLYISRQWLEPVDILFPLEKIEKVIKDGKADFISPQSFAKYLFDESHYMAAIDMFEKFDMFYPADVARLFLMYSRLIHSSLKGKDFLQSSARDIRLLLDRLDNYKSSDTAIVGNLNDLIAIFRGFLRFAVGMHPSLSRTERNEHLQKAESIFSKSKISSLHTLSPMIIWTQAQLAQGYECEKLELAASTRVNDLIVETALIENPLERLTCMTVLALLPASWKLAKGDFKGCIESATMARSLGLATVKTLHDEMSPMLDEINKVIKDPDISRDMKDQIQNFSNIITNIVDSAQISVFGSDLLILESRAKMAESRDDFLGAYELYQEAACMQRDIINRFKLLMSMFFEAIETPHKLIDESRQFEARSLYFEGMALLNRGDQFIIAGEYANAHPKYLEAKSRFEKGANLWDQEIKRLIGSQANDVSKLVQEQNIFNNRARYCDAKIEMAFAEQFAGLSEHWEAAKRYKTASSIFTELLIEPIYKEENRNIMIFRASKEFCEGRWLLEMDLADKKQTNSDDGRNLLEMARLHFEQSGESRMSLFIQGLRYEYEMAIAWVLEKGGVTQGNMDYAQIAQNKAYEAARIFRQLGIEKRAKYIEEITQSKIQTSDFRLSSFALPKPVGTFLGKQSQIQSIFDGSESKGCLSEASKELRKLHAYEKALKSTLEDLKDFLDDGRMEIGRYTDLSVNINTKLNEIQQNINSIESKSGC